MSTLVQTTIGDFIDYAMGIVGIMIVYYVIKLFTVEPPTKEDRERRRQEVEQRQAQFKDWVGGKLKEHDDKQKNHREAESKAGQKRMRERSVHVPLTHLFRAKEKAKMLLLELNHNVNNDKDREEVVEKSKKILGELHENLKIVYGSLYRLRHGNAAHFFEQLTVYGQATLQEVEHISKHLPDPTKGAEWVGNVNVIKGMLTNTGVDIGVIPRISRVCSSLIDYRENNATQEL